MGSHSLSSNCQGGAMEERRVQKISFSDHLSSKPDSFLVDMEKISHLVERDTNANSRITLQRNLSRKGAIRNGETKITGNERDNTMLTTSPRAAAAALPVSSMPEKSALVVLGPTDHSHHQITITKATAANTGAAATTDGKSIAVKRPSFRRNMRAWSDPRRILIFFATLSSMGTILLIYFTLSIGKLNGNGANASS